MKTALSILTAIVLASAPLFATGQKPERIIYNGTEYSLFTDPIESFFTESNPRPSKLFAFSCTASRRGYIATWKIDKGRLFLVRIVAGNCSAEPAVLDVSSIFKKDLPIEATWYSGILRIPRGKCLKFINAGYGSVYEEEILLTIKDGVLLKEEIKKNSRPGR
jgi:hypothetical protein